jgi:OFA family oxalate/formate antiporter-like MFS transporter
VDPDAVNRLNRQLVAFEAKMDDYRRRARVLAAAELTHLLLGGVYAWSVYSPKLVSTHGFSRLATQLAFGTTIAMFTVAMVFAGRVTHRYGARTLLCFAALAYGAGYGLAAALGATVPATLLGVGVLSGIGIGVGYVSTLTSAVAAFQRGRGLVTGFVTGAFAAGSALLAPAVDAVLDAGFSVPEVFAVQGALGCLGLMIASLGVPSASSSARLDTTTEQPRALTPGVMTWNTAGLFTASFSGLLVIGSLASIATEHSSGRSIGAHAVIAFALGNTIGRPTWGFLFDRYGPSTAPLALATLGVATLSLAHGPLPEWGVLASSLCIGFGFASAFVLYAANTVRHFGLASLGRVYPLIFLSYGLAALLGPTLGGLIFDLSGTSDGALMTAAGIAILTALGLAATVSRLNHPSRETSANLGSKQPAE